MAQAPRRGWTSKHQERAENAGYDSYGAWIVDLEEQKGHQICGAWAKSAERPCTQRMREDSPKGRCHAHGGNEQRGIASPNFRHGRYSEVLDGVLAEGYRATITGEDDGLTLLEERALLDARRDQLVHRWADGGVSFDVLRETTGELEDAIESQDRAAFVAAFERHRDAVESFLSMEDTWERIRDVTEDKRRLVETERRTLEARHEAMTRAEVLTLIRFLGMQILQAVREHVDDATAQRAVLQRLHEALARFEGGGGSGGREVDPRGNGRRR